MDLVEELLPHMRRVQMADRDLKDLSLLWSMIEAASAISCPVDARNILPTLTETRERFAELQARLVRQLGRESLAELGDELGATAQCCIDILVRNLFERTADVGFLATDDVLRDFCAAAGETQAALAPAMRARLSAYRDKYTVYDDILALAPGGQLLLRLGADGPNTASTDPVLTQALAAPGYVERYAASDLGSDTAPALLYAHRVDSAQGRSLGVLVLRFRLADELQHIFGSLARGHGATALLLLDADHRVILSNEETHVPLGALLPAGPPGQLNLIHFAGREYLAVECPARGYQGYSGPGWRAVAMVPLASAFRSRAEADVPRAGVALDNVELRGIESEVEAINRNLRRVVWNGRLVADARPGAGQNLKAVLQQISLAGARMRDRTGQAIHDLYSSGIGRACQQAGELARLAADIMDRNLYERANDCRWWALSPVLQQVLAAPVGAAGSERLNAVLRTINGLYTVYTRLLVFDADGRVCGVSNDDPAVSLLGSALPPDWLQAARSLPDAQRYAVSGFEANAASSGVPSYTYLAAVRDTALGGNRFLGGIAIVFNAEREFRAMLCDVLDGRPGLAAFVDGAGRVLACSDDSLAPGVPLPLALRSGVHEHAGAHCAVAVVPATGYREFKRQDGYVNGVQAVVCLRLGPLDKRGLSLVDSALQALPTRGAAAAAGTVVDADCAGRGSQELAIFQVGAARYALPVQAVLEARAPTGLVRVAQAGAHVAGLLDLQPGLPGQVLPVLCARSLFGFGNPPRRGDGTVLVLADPARDGQPLLGLRVDDVISVLDIAASHIQPAPDGLRQRAPWLAGMVRVQVADAGAGKAGEAIVELLDVAALLAALRPQMARTPAQAEDVPVPA